MVIFHAFDPKGDATCTPPSAISPTPSTHLEYFPNGVAQRSSLASHTTSCRTRKDYVQSQIHRSPSNNNKNCLHGSTIQKKSHPAESKGKPPSKRRSKRGWVPRSSERSPFNLPSCLEDRGNAFLLRTRCRRVRTPWSGFKCCQRPRVSVCVSLDMQCADMLHSIESQTSHRPLFEITCGAKPNAFLTSCSLQLRVFVGRLLGGLKLVVYSIVSPSVFSCRECQENGAPLYCYCVG